MLCQASDCAIDDWHRPSLGPRLRGDDISVIHSRLRKTCHSRVGGNPENLSKPSMVPSMEPYAYVYILASRRNGTLYIGVTNDLVRRTWMHREGKVPGFTQRYGVKTLVHYEPFKDINDALRREKALKKWYRQWKLRLIEESNPAWRDLWPDISGSPPARG